MICFGFNLHEKAYTSTIHVGKYSCPMHPMALEFCYSSEGPFEDGKWIYL